jgi:O-methyltransferase
LTIINSCWRGAEKMKLLIYQIGGYYEEVHRYINFEKVDSVAYVNGTQTILDKHINNIDVISINEIDQHDYDYIIVENLYYDIAVTQLRGAGVDDSRIVALNLNYSDKMYEIEDVANNNLFKNSNLDKVHPIMKNRVEPFFLVNMPLLGRDRSIDIKDRDIDYIRLSSLELVAHEIHHKNLKGNVAELGVYKGSFASKINQLFPDRNLYLFDTFEGFHSQDILIETEKAYSSNVSYLFEDTNVESVLEKMDHKDKCILKKGYFPESVSEIEDTFVFVSIDADLYQPIYEGLKYFYPRLAKGGYIFVHDYNNSVFKGAKQAVQKYCRENDISIFPLSDVNGTAIITK